MKKILYAICLTICFVAIAKLSSAQSPTVIPTPRSLEFGAVVVGSSTLPVQTFVFTGAYLSPSSGTLTVTSTNPSDVQIWDGSSFVSSFTITYSGSTISGMSIPVQFAPAVVTSYCVNVTISGGGLSSAVPVMVGGVGVSSAGTYNCSGTPTIGSPSALPASGCDTFVSSLALGCGSSLSGIVYQWQSSSTGSTWSNISGATGLSYNATITANTYFRCMATCTYSSGTASTSSVFVSDSASPTLAAISGPSTVSSGATITLANSTAGGTWTSSSPSIASVNSSTGVVRGNATGTATISYSVANACGTTVVTKVVSVTGSLNVPVAFGDAGISFTIVPNPSSGDASIIYTATQQVIVVKMYDLAGRCIYHRPVCQPVAGEGKISLPVSALAPGIYFLELNADGIKTVQKFVKQ